MNRARAGFARPLTWFAALLITFTWMTPAKAGVIHPGLRAKLDALSDGEMADVIVKMAEQAALATTPGGRAAKLQTLTATMRQTQADCLDYIEAARRNGRVAGYHQFHIVNAFSMTATRETIEAVAARSDVEIVVEDGVVQLPPTRVSVTANPEWNIDKIRAPEVWDAYGFRGAGVLVGQIDTGVDAAHPDVSAQFRGGPRDFYDAINDAFVSPFDDNGHGTHTMGTILGRNASGNDIGVAPDAAWIAAKAFSASGSGQDSWILRAMEYMLDPDGNPLTDDQPVVVNNSWGSNDGTRTVFQPAVQNWVALGIFPVFSNGNNGPGSGTVGSPASFPESFGVGATDTSDVIASFSSRGPSPITGEIKPEVSAPGVSVRSARAGGGYQDLSGTSMAAPHVTGLVALLKQAQPALGIDELRTIMETTAVDLGAEGEDNDYGHGRIDAFEAVTLVVTGGQLAGRVTEGSLILAAGEPIPNATITIESEEESPSVRSVFITHTNENGDYFITLPAGTYTVEASADGYGTDQATGVVIVEEQLTTQNFVLLPGFLQASPVSFSEELEANTQADSTLTLFNAGEGTLEVDIQALLKMGQDVAGLSFSVVDRTGGAARRTQAFPSTPLTANTSTDPPPDAAFVSSPSQILQETEFLIIDHGMLKTFFNPHTTSRISESAFSAMTAEQMADFKVIYMEPSWSSYSNLTNAMAALSAYISNGGVAVINIAGNIGNGTDIAPGGVDYSRATLHESATILDPNHPYITGEPYGGALLTTSDFNDWSSTDHGTLSDFPADATVLLQNTDGPSWIQYSWGSGHVIVTTLTYGWGSNGARGNPLFNLVEYSLFLSDVKPFPRWLTLDPTGGTIQPDSTLALNVRFDSTDLANFTYRADIEIASNDPNQPLITIPVDMTVFGAGDGDIAVTPAEVSAFLETGNTTSQTLKIFNNGAGPLQIGNITDDETFPAADAGWLSENPRFVLILPGDSTAVQITFDATGLPLGTYTANILIESSDPDAPTVTIPATLEVTSPDIAVAPVSFDRVMTFGNTQEDSLTISNGGDLLLNFSLFTRLFDPEGELLAVRTVSAPSSFPHLDLGKNDPDPRRGPPVVAGAGGPDGFGYNWIDSDEPGGPPFNWIDITGIGTPLGFSDDDYEQIALPFPFSFYGNEYTSVFVASNGILTFNEDEADEYTNEPIPDPDAPNDMIAPFWDDLDPSEGGEVYYYSDGDRFIVEWFEIPHIDEDGVYTFEVIIHRNGDIQYQYLNMNGKLNSATIGIENSDGSDGLQVAFNQDYVHDNLAVFISTHVSIFPEWFKVLGPFAGDLAPDSAAVVSLEFDTNGLPDGEYSGEIVIDSNDPDENPFVVPVRLQSSGAPPPAIAATPDAFDFALQPGAVETALLAIRNTGAGPLLYRLDEVEAAADIPWLAVFPDRGLIQGGDSLEVGITVDTRFLSEGEFAAELALTSNDPVNPEIRIPIHLRVDNPVISVAPDAVDRTLEQGDSTTVPMRISNRGGVALDFSITAFEQAGDGPVALGGNGERGIVDMTTYAISPPDGPVNAQNPPAQYTAVRYRYQGVLQGPSILLFTEDIRIGQGQTYPDQALQQLGLSYTAFFADPNGFLAALASQPWDLVIVDNLNFSRGSEFWGPIINYINNGGRVAMITWTQPSGVFEAFGVTSVTSLSTLPPLHWWEPGHPIPQGIPEMTTFPGDTFWGTDGFKVEPIPAIAVPGELAVAGWTDAPTANEASIVIANEGRTIFNGIFISDNEQDQDADGILDGVELWMNEILFLTGGGFPPWLRVSQTEGTVLPGETLDLSLTLNTVVDEDTLETGDYFADVIIRSNDPDHPEVIVPVRMNVVELVVAITDARTSNPSPSSMTIGWKTDVDTDGRVHYGTSPDSLGQSAEDERGAEFIGTVHKVDVTGLEPGTTYFYAIESAGNRIITDPSGEPLTFTTAQVEVGPPGLNAFGLVRDINGFPVSGVHVFIKAVREAEVPLAATVEESQYLSRLTNDSLAVNYSFQLGNLKDQNGSPWTLLAGDRLVLHIQGGDEGTGAGSATVIDPGAVSQDLGEVQLRATFTVDYAFAFGFNLVAMPGEPPQPVHAGDLLLDIPAQRVTRWARDTKLFESAVNFDGQIIGDYTLELGDGYFVKVDAERRAVADFFNILEDQPVSTDLIAGLNIVSAPGGFEYTSHTLLPDIPGATEVVRWAPETQSYESVFIPEGGGSPIGDVFDIDNTQGYFVRVGADVTWTIDGPALPLVAKTDPETRIQRLLAYPATILNAGQPDTRVTIANLTPVSATVVWTTDEAVLGQLSYGRNGQTVNTFTEEIAGHAHWLRLTGLTPGSAYEVRVNGKTHAFATPDFGMGQSYTVFGRAVDERGQPVPGALVTVRVRDAEGATSLPLAARTDSLGFWVVNLGNLRDAEGHVFAWQTDQAMDVTITDGRRQSVLQTPITGQSPQSTTVLTGAATTADAPASFSLAQNYPNPFNPATTIRYELPRAAHVELVVYNILGQRVVTLVNEQQAAGRYTVVWPGRNAANQTVASGVYFYRIKAGEFTSQKKMLLLK